VLKITHCYLLLTLITKHLFEVMVLSLDIL